MRAALKLMQPSARHFGPALRGLCRTAYGRSIGEPPRRQMVDLVADRVGSRFKQLARLIGRSGSILRR